MLVGTVMPSWLSWSGSGANNSQFSLRVVMSSRIVWACFRAASAADWSPPNQHEHSTATSHREIPGIGGGAFRHEIEVGQTRDHVRAAHSRTS